jgi:hypothetical protein
MALDPISAGLDFAGKLIDRLWPDPAQRDAAKLELLKMQQSGDLARLAQETDLAKGQLAVDQAEAGNANWFVAGWRPFIGWLAGVGLGVQFVVNPLGGWLAALAGHPVPFPSMDTGTLMTLLFSMLGLGAMRSAEKMQGAQGNH